jgi:hypothetical protein
MDFVSNYKAIIKLYASCSQTISHSSEYSEACNQTGLRKPYGASTLLVLVLVLARLVFVGRLIWLLFVLVNLRPHYFSCSPGFGAWGSVYLLVVRIGCSTSTSNVDEPLQWIWSWLKDTKWKITSYESFSVSLPHQYYPSWNKRYVSVKNFSRQEGPVAFRVSGGL